MRPRHVAWMCHPLSGDVPGNVARAKRWFGWLLRTFHQIDFAADSILWCEVLNDSDAAERERGLQFCEVMINRCDAVWLVGGRITPDMQRAMDAAFEAQLPIVDLTEVGDEPPTVLDPRTLQQLTDVLDKLRMFDMQHVEDAETSEAAAASAESAGNKLLS